MRKKIMAIIILILLLLFSSVAFSNENYANTILHDFSETENFDKAIPLDRTWEVYPGKILEPKDFESGNDLNPSIMSFDEITKLKDQEINGYDFGTIRTTIKVHEKNKDVTFAIYENLFLGDHSVYINNQKKINDKKLVQHKRSNNLEVPNFVTFKPEEEYIEIIINFVGTDMFSLNRKQILFGIATNMEGDMHRQIGIDLFALGVFLAISLYHGTFYLRRNNRRRKRVVMFYYITMAVIVILRVASFKDSYILTLYNGFDYGIYGKINYFAVFALAPSILLYFFEHFYEKRNHKIKLLSQIALGIYIIFIFLFDSEMYSKLVYVHMLYLISMVVIFIKWLIEGSFKKHKEYYPIIFGMIILIATSCADLIGKFINVKTSISYFVLLLLLFTIQILVMGYKYSNAFNEAEDFKEENKELGLRINTLEQEVIDTVELETKEIENKYISEKNENHSIKKIIASSEDLYVIFDEEQNIIEAIGNLEKTVTNFKDNDHKFSDILFRDNEKIRELSNNIFEKIIYIEENEKIDIYISLIPEYVKFANRTLKVKIVKTRDEKSEDIVFVALIKDVSEIKHMKESMHVMEIQNKMLKAQTKYKLPVAYLLYNAHNFFEEEVFAIINRRSDSKQKHKIIQTKVSGFYKWFGVFHFENTRQAINKLNQKLIDMNNSFDEINEKDLKMAIKAGGIISAINEDKLVIMNYITDGLELDEAEMNKYVKIKKTVDVYADAVGFISKEIDKGVNKLKIKSDDINIKLMDHLMFLDKLYVLFEILCMYDLEYEDVRKQRRKSNKGNIKLEIKDFGNKLKIIIESDGSGINLNNLKDSLFNKGIMTLEEINMKNEDDLFQYILHENIVFWDNGETLIEESIKTKDFLRSLSILGGEIYVESRYTKYLRFVIDVPLTNSDNKKNYI